MKNKLFGAVSLLIGTVVGAGIFGIPYVVSRVGFMTGFFYLLILGVVIFVTTLCYAEVILRTKGEHQMAGYAEKYLGKWGQRIISFSLVFGIYGALLAYMVGVGDFLHALLYDFLGGTPFLYTALFFILASIAVFFGLKTIIKIEKVMVAVLILAVIFIFALGVPHVEIENLIGFDKMSLFLPYGVILFAFTGATVLADVKKILSGEEKKLKKSIIIAYVVVFVIYLAFSFVVCGISGKDTSQESIIGLKNILGEEVFVVGALLGVLTMTTSFLTLGLVLKEIFMCDYKFGRVLSWVYACFVPFIIFLLGLADFIKIIGMVGAITGGLQGILILMMYLRAKKQGDSKPLFSIKVPKPIVYLLYAMYGLGIIYEVYYLFLK
ncbi:MAG: amino acid permease [Parcubacteria group bacterium]|nr:amino acid permease [Parcubacteria group bacterium]